MLGWLLLQIQKTVKIQAEEEDCVVFIEKEEMRLGRELALPNCVESVDRLPTSNYETAGGNSNGFSSQDKERKERGSAMRAVISRRREGKYEVILRRWIESRNLSIQIHDD